MKSLPRYAHMDVSNTVDVSNVHAVAAAVESALKAEYPQLDSQLVQRLFTDFDRLYAGDFPGYHGCDVGYHNAHHVLDVTLAMARLLDGFARGQRIQGAALLSLDLVYAGVAGALFHDSGYIRRRDDTQHSNGAAYTRIHVQRSATFLADYLPEVGLEHLVAPCTRIVQFTAHNVNPRELQVNDHDEYMLGSLLGTADLIAQMADADYPRKCRESLYEEFVIGGLAGEAANGEQILYDSPEQLLSLTPAFIRDAIDTRLDGHFEGVHRFAAAHFDGQHLYMKAIEENDRVLRLLIRQAIA